MLLLVLQNSKQRGQAEDTEKQGTWAQCSIPSCGKWRFLQNDVDPQKLPERWVCSMNESKALFSLYISNRIKKNQYPDTHNSYSNNGSNLVHVTHTERGSIRVIHRYSYSDFFVQIMIIALLLLCPDDDYNTCSVSQETFDSQEGNLHVMYTPYPSGAVVWAKMVGYPW